MTVFRVVGGLFTGVFGIVGLVWGLVSLVMAILFLIPFFGWLNWILIPFAGLGIIFGIIANASPDTRGLGNSVITLCGISITIAVLKLALFGGII